MKYKALFYLSIYFICLSMYIITRSSNCSRRQSEMHVLLLLFFLREKGLVFYVNVQPYFFSEKNKTKKKNEKIETAIILQGALRFKYTES